MKLFIEKSEKIDVKYKDKLDLSYATVSDDNNLSITLNSTSSYNSSVDINDIKFFDRLKDGDPFLIEISITINKTNTARNTLELEYGTQTILLFDTNVSSDIKEKIPLSYEATEDKIISFTLYAHTDDYSITISSINIKIPTLLPIPILNSDEVEINKQIKDFDNITDIKASYTNNIKLKYTPEIIENFGYFTEISTSEIYNSLNGIRSILTTDDAYFIAEGIINIQQIIKSRENYIIDIFFTSYISSFFHKLSSENLNVPHIWCENTLSDRQTNFQQKSDSYNDDYNYTFVADNYLFYDNSLINNYDIHSGFFELSVIDWTSSIVDIGLTKTNKTMPIHLGYSGMPALSQPAFKHKYILETLHKKYGYTVETEIFNDPKYYNLHIAPSKNNDKDIVSVNDMKFEGTVVLDNNSGLTDTVWLTALNLDTNYFGTTAATFSNEETFYDVIESTYNDYEKMYGDKVNKDFKGFISKKNMRLSGDAKLTFEFKKEEFASTNIRVIITDNVIDLSNNYIQMNPYSTHIIKDFIVEAPTGTTTSTQTIEFEYNDILYLNDTDNNIARGFKVHIITDGYQPTRVAKFTTKATLEITNIEIYENGVLNNPYWMDDELSFNISEKTFIRDFITKFNLIPEIDYINKIVYYYEFDKFYEDGEFLDWSDKIDRNKDLLYLYGKNNNPDSYKFTNNSKKKSEKQKEYEELNDKNYAELIVESIYDNTKIQNIQNLISNLFFDYEDGRMYGLYNNSDDELYGGFPLYCAKTVFMKQETFILYDKTALDEKRYRFDEKSNRENTIIGYINPIKGKTQIINGHIENGVPFVNSGLFAYGPIFRNDTTGTHSSYNHITLEPKYLAPFNVIDSSSFKSTSYNFNNFYNSLVYDDSINSTINLYDEYRKEINNFTLPTNYNDNHLLECFVVLGLEEYSNLKLSETIKIDNRYYIIKKISNFLDNRPTKITLMSWRYKPHGKRYIYNTDKIPAVIAFSNDIDLSVEGKIYFNNTTEQTIGFFTNYHKTGSEYTVKFTWTSYGDDVDFEAYSRNGLNDFVTLHDVSGSVEYTYTRTQSSYSYYNLETIKMKAAQNNVYITYKIEIIK